MSDSSTMFTLVFSDTLSTAPHLAQRLGDYSTCLVRPSHSYPFHLPPQEIKIDEILYSSERTAVYSGRCANGLELVLKFTNIKDMSAEAGAYDAFENLQGTKTEKAKILNKLAEAHRTGLFPLDFAERNVVVKDDDYRLIDLGRAERHDPPCRWTYDFTAHVEDDDVKSTDPSVQCGSIKSWAEDMRFWDHGKLILSRTILLPKSDKLPPQHIVDCLSTAIGLSSDHDYIMTDRKQIGAKYLTIVWEQMTKHGMLLEDVQKRRQYFTYLAHKEWHDERNEIFVPLPGMNFTSRKPQWLAHDSKSSFDSEATQ
ncbi:hypothetical protein EUX98_g9300 [Antrodiella citrinella]|uniref:Protein kinase domain-containing protein n=1 Tax=Antrodiella citrinella TaxID=2447956 RepID=A0A4V3XF80_9APHY|nr:hypothetical protein EUX98_g9300 [Antrodiella citrinella]